MPSLDFLQGSFKHGLVIGKFYPPHLGHCLLIRNAAAASQRVTVVVMASRAEQLDLDVRVACLRETFSQMEHVRVVGIWDDVPVDYDDESVWLAHIALMRDGVALADEEFDNTLPVDAVFTSESYGERMAGYFDAVSVQVDVPRVLMPVSGTATRTDLYTNWRFLPTSVQRYLCHRVVVVGGESSGKSTLAQALTNALVERGGVWANTPCVPEYGREYNQLKLRIMQGQARRLGQTEPSVFDCEWRSQEFVTIARMQTAWEQIAAAQGSPVMVCDTDAFATLFWHERYMGGGYAALQALVAELPKRSLYVLPDIRDVRFEQDGLRDGEHVRFDMHDRFRQALQNQSVPWLEVRGSVMERVAQTMHAIDQLRHPFETQISPPEVVS